MKTLYYKVVGAADRDLLRRAADAARLTLVEWKEGAAFLGGALFAIVDRPEAMGRTALTAAARGFRGAVLYEERYLVTFGGGRFRTDSIAPEAFALPPRGEWGDRERLLWTTGLLLYAFDASRGLLPCMDEARRLVRNANP